LLWRLQNGELPDGRSTVDNVVVHIGINSVNRGASSAEVLAGILKVVAFLESEPSIGKVFILPLLPGTKQNYDTIRKVNSGLSKASFSRPSTKIIGCGWDIFADKTSGYPITAIKSLMPDKLHPNVAGLIHWSRCIEKEMN